MYMNMGTFLIIQGDPRNQHLALTRRFPAPGIENLATNITGAASYCQVREH